MSPQKSLSIIVRRPTKYPAKTVKTGKPSGEGYGEGIIIIYYLNYREPTFLTFSENVLVLITGTVLYQVVRRVANINLYYFNYFNYIL